MDGDEEKRRKWPRMALALDVKMRFDNVDHAISAETSNISREGLFIAMVPPRRLGTTVRAQVDIGDEHFVLEGVVVHAVPDPDDPNADPNEEPAGVGVFLTSVSDGWLAFCDGLVDRKNSGEFTGEDTMPERSPLVIERVRKSDHDE